MVEQLKHESIASSLFAWWHAHFPLAVTTLFPGMRGDGAAHDEWLELWVDAWSRRAQRATALQIVDVSLSVHCFVRKSNDKSRVLELVDAARGTIAHATIPLRDYDASGTPLVGYAKLFEPESRDLTRREQETLAHWMQHHAVLCRGIAQQT